MTAKSFSLNECKIQASILLKQLRRTSNIELINTFRQLPMFLNMDNAQICRNVKLKHALHIIANKYGFFCWNNLKSYFEKTGITAFKMHSGFLNHWFSNYLEAKAYLNTHRDNFLLPYKQHFVVCKAECIEHMGLDPQNSNWALIQHNWVEPQDYKAWEALNAFYTKIGTLSKGQGEQNA
jgi:hypothetical protein